MTKEVKPVKVIECEGCKTFFSCKLTKTDECDGLGYVERHSHKPIDLATFQANFSIYDGKVNILPVDKDHVLDMVREGQCYCNNCSDHTPKVHCGEVSSINWEKVPILMYKLSEKHQIELELYDTYTKLATTLNDMKQLNAKVKSLKKELQKLQEKGKCQRTSHLM